MDLNPGTIVDRYTVEAPLGEGGMAVVYRVRHRQLGSLHALKVLSLKMPSVRERLVQEGRVQASLRHPNIVSVTDIIEVDGAPGLIMEFVDGPNLEALLERHRPTLEEAEALGVGIISGVASAHKLGLIHRDLKPANVLMALTDAGPVPKVADFGLAKLVNVDGAPMSRTRSGQAMGTPSYMAPEQIRNAKGADKRADIFSLGAILYDLACGTQAFPGGDILTVFTAIASGDYRPPREVNPELPERMVRAIEGALKVKPEERIPDCETLLSLWTGVAAKPGGHTSYRSDAEWSPALLATLTSSQGSFTEVVVGRKLSSQTYDVGGALEAMNEDVGPSDASAGRTVYAPHAGRASGESRSAISSVGPTIAPTTTLLPPEPASPVSGPGGLRGALIAGVAILSVALLLAVWRPWNTDAGATADLPAPALVAAGATSPALPPTPPVPGSPVAAVPAPDAFSGSPVVASTSPGVPASPLPPSSGSTAPPASGSTAPTPSGSTAAASPSAASSRRASATVAPSASGSKVSAVPDTSPSAAPAAAAASASSSTSVPIAAAPAAAAPVASTPPTTATVALKGDARRVWLESSAGRFPAGEVPPGTYKVTAFFDGVDPVTTGEITLKAGDVRELRCSSQLMVCR